MSVIGSAARVLHVLVTGIWLGAGALCILLVFLVPETLDSRQAAEAVLSATRARLDLFGLLAGPVLLLTLAVGWVPLMVRLKMRFFVTLAGTGAAALSGRYLVPKMREVMDAMGRPLQDLPSTDPLVTQYLELSVASLGTLGVQVLAALLLVVTAVAAGKPKKQSYGIEL